MSCLSNLNILEMEGMWPFMCCFVGCRFKDLFNIASIILVQLPSSLFSLRLDSVHDVHPYINIDPTAALKKLHFVLSFWFTSM